MPKITLQPIDASDVIAFVALLIAVAALGFEIRALRRQLLVQNFFEHTKRYHEVFNLLPSSVIAADFALSSLDVSEKEKVLRPMWAYFDLCWEEYFLRERRLISRRLWRIWRQGIQQAMRRPAFQQGWAAISATGAFDHAPKFRGLLNELARRGGPQHDRVKGI